MKRRTPEAVANGLMAMALLVVACSPVTQESESANPSGNDSIAGTYNCLQPGASDPDIVELQEDGTLTITHPDGVTEAPGTWSVDGDQGAFGPEVEGEPFTVEEGDLLFEDGTVCTLAQ